MNYKDLVSSGFVSVSCGQRSFRAHTSVFDFLDWGFPSDGWDSLVPQYRLNKTKLQSLSLWGLVEHVVDIEQQLNWLLDDASPEVVLPAEFLVIERTPRTIVLDPVQTTLFLSNCPDPFVSGCRLAVSRKLPWNIDEQTERRLKALGSTTTGSANRPTSSRVIWEELLKLVLEKPNAGASPHHLAISPVRKHWKPELVSLETSMEDIHFEIPVRFRRNSRDKLPAPVAKRDSVRTFFLAAEDKTAGHEILELTAKECSHGMVALEAADPEIAEAVREVWNDHDQVNLSESEIDTLRRAYLSLTPGSEFVIDLREKVLFAFGVGDSPLPRGFELTAPGFDGAATWPPSRPTRPEQGDGPDTPSLGAPR